MLILDTYTSKSITRLEAVQCRLSRLVCHDYHQTSSIDTMITLLGWPSLHSSWKKAQLSSFYNYHHNLISVNSKSLLSTVSTCRSSCQNHWQWTIISSLELQNWLQKISTPNSQTPLLTATTFMGKWHLPWPWNPSSPSCHKIYPPPDEVGHSISLWKKKNQQNTCKSLSSVAECHS